MVQKMTRLTQARMTIAGSVGGLLDGAKDDQVDVGDSGGVGDYWMVQKMTRLMQVRTTAVQVDYWMVQKTTRLMQARMTIVVQVDYWMMYGAEDDLIDVGKNDSGGVGGLLDAVFSLRP